MRAQAGELVLAVPQQRGLLGDKAQFDEPVGGVFGAFQLIDSLVSGEGDHAIDQPNHAPLMIAEEFGMLEALAPGRIDLGLGRAPGTDPATAAALRRHHDANDGFPQQVLELLGFLGDSFPENHPYRQVHAVPGPWQADQNRVPRPRTSPNIWILGSSLYSAQLAAQLGRPYAFALQFGDADVTSAMRLYRDNFQPSAELAEPYTLVSVGAVVDDDPELARRQTASSAMAMLRMFQRKSYALLPPDEVDAYQPTLEERNVLETYNRRFLNGTAPAVAADIEKLHDQTGVDEVMLVVMGHSRRAQARTIDLIADHYAMASDAMSASI